MWLIATLLVAFKAFHTEGLDRLLWSVSSAVYLLFAVGHFLVLTRVRYFIKSRAKS
mgnify:CR=1 FL=1